MGDSSNLVKILTKQQYGLISKDRLQKRVCEHLLDPQNVEPIQRTPTEATVSSIELDLSEKLLISGDAVGNLVISSVNEETTGKLSEVARTQFTRSSLNRCQWYPWDTELLSITYSDSLQIVDVNSLAVTESYTFGDSKVFWSDWNTIDVHLICVGTNSSNIRFVDIRCGNALHEINVPSLIGKSKQSVTRVLWSPLDAECVIVGDSSGYMHVFDTRNSRKPVLTVSNDSTVCEPVVSLVVTRDKMNFITCSGSRKRLKMWSLKTGKIVNSDINYPVPYFRRKEKAQLPAGAALMKCQIHVTDSHLLCPQSDGLEEILVYDLWTGDILGTLTANCYHSGSVTCVTGLSNRVVYYSGGKRNVKTWGIVKKPEEKTKQVHMDNWSDSE